MAELFRTSIDRTALPGDLVPLLKSHCRVEFSRDDLYLETVAARAIDLFERLTGWLVFGRLYDWTVTMEQGALAGTAWRWPAPVAPFTGFTAFDQAVDVSGQYRIVAASPDLVGPAWLERASGQPDAVPVLTAASGYASADELPPGVLDFVLRSGAWLYEYREAGMMPGADMLAYGNSLLAGQWVPRA